ncbi:MAG: amidohydrolase [Rhodospirillaceae bacterium]|nr:amidohydrolase [Rhodospirillaceae bacterium]
MGQTLFTNVRIFDGNAKRTYSGEVLLQGNLIQKVAKSPKKIKANGADVIDGAGATLMPGLIEPHAHICYVDGVALPEIGRIPPADHMVLALENARVMLDAGFTGCFSAAGVGESKLRIEIALRDAINSGKFPGPRLLAASPEITSTAGLGDERKQHMYEESVGLVADGADEVRRACRMCVREGVDNLKINISGDEFVRHGHAQQLTYNDAEVAAAAEVAEMTGVNIACHARADQAVRMALKHGINIIYHADYANNKTLDMLEAKKKDVFLAPAVGIVYTAAYEASDWGITTEIAESMNMLSKLENTYRVYHEVRKRGIRALPGGDYGFAFNPIGTNARDLEHFVNLFGYSPSEALIAATKLGGELMGMNLGQVKEGYLADLLLVDGDPTHDVSILQDRDSFLAILKDGNFHKTPDPDVMAARRQIAAPAAAE